MRGISKTSPLGCLNERAVSLYQGMDSQLGEKVILLS